MNPLLPTYMLVDDDDESLWKLLQFDSFEEYFECMVLVGFVKEKHNVTKLPYFVAKKLNNMSEYVFQNIYIEVSLLTNLCIPS